MTVEQERKSKRIALITSLGVHGALLLLLLFMVAWRAPNPPLPEFGIELNFGTDETGTGDVQPETPVGAEETQAEEAEEQPEEIPLPEPEEIAEEVVEEAAPDKPVTVQPEVVSKTESPVVVEEKKEAKPVEKPAEKPVEKAVEKKPEETPKAVYKPKNISNRKIRSVMEAMLNEGSTLFFDPKFITRGLRVTYLVLLGFLQKVDKLYRSVFHLMDHFLYPRYKKIIRQVRHDANDQSRHCGDHRRVDTR